MKHRLTILAAGLVALTIVACVPTTEEVQEAQSVTRTGAETRSTANVPSTVPNRPREASRSAESTSYQRYYRTVQNRLVGQGMLRTDGGQSDAPMTADELAENFERIALFNEYSVSGGRFVQQQTASHLRRWEQPVRIQAHFGDSVAPAQESIDRAELNSFVSRLARITRHPIRTVSSGGNFHVLYINRDEQATIGDLVETLVPGVSNHTIAELEHLSRFTFCTVFAFSETGGRPVYVNAVAIIREEHPDLLRRSCVHEEVAQGLGLPNDSPAARPSIFNDDEEFAFLTPHDEMLLRILYDRRLTPGLEPLQARPIVRQIVDEMME